ncbi:Alpha/Beta hydrolase protein [Lasiosphaeris hirsuta]|uniref:Alpha/Beta hydrolase protein n=1 Tax=Lasiosphaeris hirsuta TaxID=260670 RepID=A0AA40AYJ0_9PEZI|nr:Alpha/Beta hydrolase protein [Lasiosphaeris hirsuta]
MATPPSNESAHATPKHGEEGTGRRRETPALLSKLSYAGQIYSIRGFTAPGRWLRDWKEYFYPPVGAPNFVKTYECRPDLPVRVFFPASYDQISPKTLPTLFTIHGGGFCIGHVRDDDEWNRAFADGQDVLVIALNYSKAPAAPFPTAIHDLEALLLALLSDESLPIDRAPHLGRGRNALLGFSAGGNLALAVSQLPTVRDHVLAPAAAVSVYGYLDLSVPAEEKTANRPFKPSLELPRGGKVDALLWLMPAFDWSYVPYGHDLRDPLLSPYFATRDHLPPYVGIVAAELDFLAHEGWRTACRLAREGLGEGGWAAEGGRYRHKVPDRLSKEKPWRVCGREEVSSRVGELERDDGRFSFEESWLGGGVKWLLVPDVLHGFDNQNIRALMGGEETVRDAEAKTKAFMDELGLWLRDTVWKV